MRNKKQLSYKLIIIFFIFLVLLIIGSVVAMRILIGDVQSINRATDEKYSHHYAFIRPEGDQDFWDNVYQGAINEGETLGAYVEDFGNNLTVAYSQNELIQIAIDAGVDGIIISADSTKNTSKLINEASKKGIPVVTVLNDNPESNRICFVGVSSYTMGRQYGEQILNNLNLTSDDLARVSVMMDSNHNDSGQELVISGITDVFAEAGVDDRISIEGIYIDNSTAFGAEEDIRDIFLNNDIPEVMIALNSVYTRCLFQAAVDYNKVGDVILFGFHDSDDILDAVSKSIIGATMSVNTWDIGSTCIDALEEYINTGYVSAYLTQDTEMILEEEATARLNAEDEEND